MPTLTGFSDMAPSPRVQVSFSAAELDPAVATVTVVQISAAGEAEVREGRGVNAVGGAQVTDYEVPPGIPVTYRAEQFDVSGVSLGLTASATTQVDIDPGYVVVQDFLAPRNAVLVDAHESFAGEVRTSRASARYRAGRNTLVLMGEVGLAEQVPLTVNTRTLADADMLGSILAEGTALIRSMPNVVRIPQLFYCAIPDVVPVPIDVQYGGEWIRWDLVGDEISRPDIAVIEPLFSWGLYKSAFPTWGDAKAAYTTWLDAKSNPPAEA